MPRSRAEDELDPSRVPAHVAIIMDGNRRWARARGLPAAAGHAEGARSLKAVVAAARDAGVKVLTVYAFSTENWARPKLEVRAIMTLLCRALREYSKEMKEKGVRLRFSGRLDEMPPAVRAQAEETTRLLEGGRDITLNIALNYGGRREIVDAVNALIAGKKSPVTEDDIARRLYTWPLPDPDLLIRTSGEMRISNFLLWQTAYSEFYVTDTLWPAFKGPELIKALLDYQRRDRRKGT
ncbi:MAG: polyprenyl diphosphate synthase [Elusimicrobiales bacterium]|jgi:undecaprenyl diphosphate synthase|nr:polyprenyl diphosphate synthase [Elusimicrobiales bacterium]